ncbi:hypothetical protein BPAE_0134g00210 [Botrytis paeoniae]|uniref:Uncharacterized protein n=1 Tax=Botrytis paeoniae TaxID=278948 RepID=A0A4Z1FNX4_9HELO|nr:hypothetical protein BPAE_0134g00210 [Botrytis paeoniae]
MSMRDVRCDTAPDELVASLASVLIAYKLLPVSMSPELHQTGANIYGPYISGYNSAKAAKIQGYDSGNEAEPLLHDDLRGCIEHTPSNNLY